MGINKVILVGNVGGDPEIQYVQENLPVARFSFATSETYKNKEGEKVTNTEWHNIVVWRGLAKVVEQYVKKGAKLYLEGKITYRKYENEGQVKYFTDIVVRDLQMLDGKEGGSSQSSAPANQNQASSNPKNATPISQMPVEPVFTGDIDDLPF